MSLYLLIFFVILLCTAIGSNKRAEPIAYAVAFFLMFAFLTLRFGQGTDWLGYNYIFSCAPSAIDFKHFYYTDAVHSEIGWKAINNLAKCLGLDFVFISVTCSVIEMLLLSRFICRYSSNRSLSLLIAFPVVYFVYFFSAFRNGLVIAFFLGVMIEMIEKKNTLGYVALSLVLSTIHSASLFLLIVLLMKEIPVSRIGTTLVLCACAGIVFSLFSGQIYQLLNIPYSSDGVSWLALLYRAIMFSFVFFLYSGKAAPSNQTTLLYKIYSIGFGVYLLFAGSELIASRLAAPFLAVDMVLIPLLLKGQAKQGALIALCIVSLTTVMYVKNINASIDQGTYVSGITVANYPYISVFNRNDVFLYSHNRFLSYLLEEHT